MLSYSALSSQGQRRFHPCRWGVLTMCHCSSHLRALNTFFSFYSLVVWLTVLSCIENWISQRQLCIFLLLVCCILFCGLVSLQCVKLNINRVVYCAMRQKTSLFNSILFSSEWELLLCTIEDRNKCYRNYKYTLAPNWLYSVLTVLCPVDILNWSPPSFPSPLQVSTRWWGPVQ